MEAFAGRVALVRRDHPDDERVGRQARGLARLPLGDGPVHARVDAVRHVQRVEVGVLEHPLTELGHGDRHGERVTEEVADRPRARLVVDRHPARRVQLPPDHGVQDPDVHQRDRQPVTEVAVVVDSGVVEDGLVAVRLPHPGVDRDAVPFDRGCFDPVKRAYAEVVVVLEAGAEQGGLLAVSGR
jgi:hypothetical protein